MPYIRNDLRGAATSSPINPGELNFAITSLVCKYLRQKKVTPRYEDYNEVIGALESAKLELYRRMISPYEDEKKKLNGDVY